MNRAPEHRKRVPLFLTCSFLQTSMKQDKPRKSIPAARISGVWLNCNEQPLAYVFRDRLKSQTNKFCIAFSAQIY